MTEMVSIPADELAHLKDRARKSASDKSYLQLVIRLMNNISAASGFGDTVDCLLRSIIDVMGGANIYLYYPVNNGVVSVDVFGHKMTVEQIDDDRVQQVFISRKAVEFEHAFSDTRMMTPEFTKAYTWIYPLLVGQDLVGVLKMESLHIGMSELYKHLPTFFNFAALILKNSMGADALRESEEKFRTLVNNLNTGVYRATNGQGRILQANPALARIFGFDSLQEFMETPVADLYQEPEERKDFIEKVRHEGLVKDLELAMRKKDGTAICCSVTVSAQYDDNHDIKWVEGVVDDITERKRAEESLHIQAIELEQEVAERQMAQESLQLQATQLEKEIEERRKAQDALVQLNEMLEQRVQERTHELKERNDEVQRAYDDLKMVQGQLLQQDKMASIGHLAAGVAHEINNPMGFIISNLGSLGRYVDKLGAYMDANEQYFAGCDPAVMEYLVQERKKYKIDRIRQDLPELIAESHDGAERVRKIVQDLKSFSRIDASTGELSDINEGLESTLSIAWNELKYKATVTKEYGQLPRVWCNMGQLNQVFLNILVNAAHAIEEQGEIRITTCRENDVVKIAISDTGGGIPPENVKRIFEPFFTTKEVGKGTGLGLAIAYDIVVNKHSGQIEVTSDVGVGTTFTIGLPIRRDDQVAES